MSRRAIGGIANTSLINHKVSNNQYESGVSEKGGVVFRLSNHVWIFGLGLMVSLGIAPPLAAQPVQDDAVSDGTDLQSFFPDDPWALLRAAFPADGRRDGNDDIATQLRPNFGQDADATAGQNADPATAGAQTGGRPGTYRAQGFESRLETVADRRREELDAIGLKTGTYTFFPEIQISTTRTDNVFSTATAKKSDAILALRPSFTLRSDWRRNSLAVAGEGEWAKFNRYKSENVLRGSLTGEARVDFTPFIAAGLRLSIAADQEGRGSPDAVTGAAGPVRLRTYGAELSLAQRLNRLVATLRGGLALTDYDDVDLLAGGSDNNDDRDARTNSVGLRLAYELSPAASVYGDLELDRQINRQRIDDEGFQRSSEGWRAALGTNVEIGRLARLDLEVGYVAREYNDPRLAATGAVTADGLLTWSMTPLTTLRFAAGTDVAATTVALASARVTRRVSFGVDHELLRQFTLGADIAYENERLRGVGDAGRSDTISASVGGEYRLSREASIEARFRREVERARDNSGDTTENIASVGLTLRR